jgi:hypothetical protein
MKIFTSVISFLILQSSLQAQLIEDWSRNTNLFPNGARGTLQMDSENNLVVVRDVSFAGSENYDHAIQKYSSEGELVWEIENDDPFDAINFNVYDWTIDSDDNIVLVGDQFNTQLSYRQSYAMKVSPAGDVLWQHPVTDILNWSEGLESVAVSDDGSIFAYGMLYNPEVNTLGQSLVKMNPAGEVLSIDYLTDYYLQQLETYNNRIFSASGMTINEFNLSGDVIWHEEFEFEEGETLYQACGLTSIQKFYDNTFTTVATLETAQLQRFLIARRFSLDGAELWSEVIDAYAPNPAENEMILPLDFTINDNGETYIIGEYSGGGGGKGGDFGDEYQGIFIVALNASGDVLWRNTIDATEEFQSFYPIAVLWSMNEVLVISQTQSFGANQQHVVSFHAATGSINWTDIQGTTEDFISLRPSYAITSNDDAIYISGIANVEESNEQYLYLNKYHVTNTTIQVDETETASNIQLWPNPATDIVWINCQDIITETRILSMDGKIVKLVKGNFNQTLSVNINGLANGIYTIVVQSENSTRVSRLVKN